GGLEVDDQLEPGRLLHRQIGGFGAIENLSGVGAELAPYACEARSIADQAARRRVFTPVIDRRNGMPCGQPHQLVESAVEERVAGDDQPAGIPLDEGCESTVDLAFDAGLQYMKL